MTGWRRVQDTVAGVCVVLLVVLLWVSLRVDPPATRAASTVRALPPVLLVTGSASMAPLADKLAQSSAVVVHDGQGFGSGPGLFTTLPADLAAAPAGSAVVVQAGEHDVAAAAGRTQRAVEQMLDRLRLLRGASTDVVVVGPVPRGRLDPDLLRVRREVAAAATAKGVAFVDPVVLAVDAADRWALDAVAEAVRVELWAGTAAPAAAG